MKTSKIDIGVNSKNSHFSLSCEDLFDSWLKYRKHNRSHVLYEIKEPLTAIEGFPFKYLSL